MFHHEDRGKESKYKARVKDLAKKAFSAPKKYEDVKKKYPMKHFKTDKLESASKKAGFYVHGHKNYGDVYEP